MNSQAIVIKLRRRCTGTTQRAVAEQLGVTVSYLNDVLQQKREPGPKILTALGLERRISYRPIR